MNCPKCGGTLLYQGPLSGFYRCIICQTVFYLEDDGLLYER